jgi:hypothetical protein
MITNICKNIITDAARHISMVIIAAMCIFPSCTDYLDIVPDNSLTLEDVFSVREKAYNALAKIYFYQPPESHTYYGTTLYGDEYMGPANGVNSVGAWLASRLLLGQNNVTAPLNSYWINTAGTEGGVRSLYEGINTAYVFLANIDKVNDMDDKEKSDWKAQAKFMIGYYHFFLLRQTGPIVLKDKETKDDALGEDLFPHRAKIEDCFDFIIRCIDEAIPNLEPRRGAAVLGQIDRVGAAAMKARVLLYRASPFYNGNSEFYGSFLNHKNEHFFPQTYDKEKWKAAGDAIDVAINLAKQEGKDLYTFDKTFYIDDREDYEKQPARMQTLYDLTMIVPDPWNKELLWGLSRLDVSTYITNYRGEFAYTIIPGVQIQAKVTAGGNVAGDQNAAVGWLGSTYKMLETFYTKNGLPIDEDRSFDRSTMYNQVNIPGISDPLYEEVRGYLQPGALTLQIYLDREPRFYADLGITGGYWRSHASRISTTFFYGQPGSSSGVTRYIETGIGVQKLVHPESLAGASISTFVQTPWPLIRMADLYLMKAEALNEYLDAPTQDVYNAINLVRKRAGIPNVETVWSDATKARTVNKHKTKEGMRDIILQERGVELAFEGHRFWDMHRYKKAHTEFTESSKGWTYTGTTAAQFFVLKTVQEHIFTIKDYLWPIPISELNINSNLIQNPGW